MIVHQTKTNRILAADVDGWEFACQLCGYRAQYITSDGANTLEVLSAGDPQVRHTSSPTSASEENHGSIRSAARYGGDEDLLDSGDQVWLPPHIEQQLIKILRRFDGFEK